MTNDQLRALAEAATPGPWEADSIYGLVAPSQIDGFVFPDERAAAEHWIQANSAFIAAANPATVLALLDHVTELQGRIDRVLALLDEDPNGDGVTWWTWIEDGLGGSLHDDLRAALTARTETGGN